MTAFPLTDVMWLKLNFFLSQLVMATDVCRFTCITATVLAIILIEGDKGRCVSLAKQREKLNIPFSNCLKNQLMRGSFGKIDVFPLGISSVRNFNLAQFEG